MSKVKIKFNEAGKWADETSQPVFEVKAGDEKFVTPATAQFAVSAGKASGEFVAHVAGPIPKAEGKKKEGKKKGGKK